MNDTRQLYVDNPRDFDLIPMQTLGMIHRYRDSGMPLGGFLCAVMSNDLRRAVSDADGANSLALLAIVTYVHNRLPAGCWGTPERYSSWVRDGGLDGINRRAAGAIEG